jgi:hypothetical protein
MLTVCSRDYPTRPGTGWDGCLWEAAKGPVDGLISGRVRTPKERRSNGSYQGETWILDSPEGVSAGQARFKYPATFVLFSNPEFHNSCGAALRLEQGDASPKDRPWAEAVAGWTGPQRPTFGLRRSYPARS